MSIPWSKRKARLTTLLNSGEDEDAISLALDRILHGQSVIGKTSKTTKIDNSRFTDADLDLIGTLEFGQFAVIDVVSCKLDGRVYVRKSIEKRFALRTRDQCSPQFERDLLLSAMRTQTEWAPHLLCAFQTPTHLNLVMDYAEGGTLWDVLESSPLDGKISESDAMWWAPQIVSAIHWCHSQGFVHRDVKPHNFVLKPDGHLMVIDFGSAAPLLPPQPDGSRKVPKRHCLVPCGTCDYISPDILQAHEAALVALEMSDEPIEDSKDDIIGGYGRETDWWSLGAMLYEMVYGVAPFFANDIRQTYSKIMDHNRSLRFDSAVDVSSSLQDLLRRFLTDAELRLGRCDVEEIYDHSFFSCIDWESLSHKPPLPNLHLPQFTYATPVVPSAAPPAAPQSPGESSSHSGLQSQSQSYSRGFAFSALFQSSPTSSPGIVLSRNTPSQPSSRSILREQTIASFIGFSWGPTRDAFHSAAAEGPGEVSVRQDTINTPRSLRHTSVPLTPYTFIPPTPGFGSVRATATPGPSTPTSPVRHPYSSQHDVTLWYLPRASTIRRTAPRRAVSDREAMKQLVDCVGMSARKKVLESGRKPRILTKFNFGSGTKTSSTLKELRFDRSVMVMNETGISFKLDPGPTSASTSVSGSGMMSVAGSALSSVVGASGSHSNNNSQVHSRSLSMLSRASRDNNTSFLVASDTESSMSSNIPPSPSPSPRPGSAMSMMSRRSQTPTITGSYFLRVNATAGSRSGDTMKSNFLSPLSPVDPVWRSAMMGTAQSAARDDTTVENDMPTEISMGTRQHLEPDVWDKLQQRHDRLMRDIADLDGKLMEVAIQIQGGE